MHKYVACCGLYCGACGSMLMHELQQDEASAAHFVCEYEESPCPGCGDGCAPDCEFKRCCAEHEVENCGFCPEFPCAVISQFSVDEWPHHIDVLENLARIRDVGIAVWLKEQSMQWQCPGCGKRTHWYQSACPACGAQWEARYK